MSWHSKHAKSGILLVVFAILALSAWRWTSGSRAPSIADAEAAARSGDWSGALDAWRRINATVRATSHSHLGEARAYLALSHASRAEQSLRAAIAINPSDPEPWRLLLKILRMESRVVEAQRLGWVAYEHATGQARRELLGELTLTLMADLPDDLVRGTLERWSHADGDDIEVRVALLRRIAAQPRAADPDREALLNSMRSLLAANPDHANAREMLVTALGDSGEPEQGRDLLDAWPEADRDARYWNLRGRWQLEYDNQAELAVVALDTALRELPQDWRAWYRLTRAFSRLGKREESKRAAERVRRIRELLDPLALGPQLDRLFEHLNTTSSLAELAQLVERAGLDRLAKAWRRELEAEEIKSSESGASRAGIPTPMIRGGI